jgi:high-affinity nickel-transport protein
VLQQGYVRDSGVAAISAAREEAVMDAITAGTPVLSRWQRVKGGLDPGQWQTVFGMAAVIVALHVIGFGLLFLVVAPNDYTLGASGAFTVGVGFTAYALGMRHAFDADHIAAIDNTTRKLMNEGKRPISVGFFFSLGHSTVVFVLAFLFAIGIKALSGQVADDGSSLHNVTGWIGSGVSGTFLYVIAALNIVILVGILGVVRDMKRGEYDEDELERQLDNRGLMNRFYRRFTRTITEPWQMYPIGLLFGLGFDTATEVALLFLAAGAAGAGLPFYAILCLPILFAAGMSLLDTIDGSFMNFAYGWAFSKPVRKIFYNITITALSVFIALVIGSIEMIGLLSEKAGLDGSLWAWFQAIDINTLGLMIAGIFVLTWAVALSVWHFGDIEQRWTAQIKDAKVD